MPPSDDPERPLAALEAAAWLREEADRLVESQLRAGAEAGRPSTCREGCAACCRQLVVVSPLEAHAIGDYLAARPETAAASAGRAAAWEAAAGADPELAELLVAFETAGGYPAPDVADALETACWRAQLPCPFLESERCSIYPVRPFACREHHVVSEPRLCAESPDEVTSAGTRLEFKTVAARVGELCYGIPDRLLLLPRAAGYAAAAGEEAARTAPQGRVRAVAEDARRRARMALALIRLASRSR